MFLSDGDGTFTHKQTLTLTRTDADFPKAITAATVNAGNTVDLVISNLGTANVTILTDSGVAGSNRCRKVSTCLLMDALRPVCSSAIRMATVTTRSLPQTCFLITCPSLIITATAPLTLRRY